MPAIDLDRTIRFYEEAAGTESFFDSIFEIAQSLGCGRFTGMQS